MTPEDHRRTFALAMSVLLTEFNAYLDRADADPIADSVGYAQFVLWLTDEERTRLISQVIAALTTVRDNEASADRRPYLVSPILIPTEPNAST
jgi:hypothetical protein